MPTEDPLYRLRHAIAGVGLALLLSVFVAALLGRLLGDAFGDSYTLRASIYAALLLAQRDFAHRDFKRPHKARRRGRDPAERDICGSKIAA